VIRRPRSRAVFQLMVVVFICLIAALSETPAQATIRYEISLARPARHFFHVAMTIPNVNGNVTVQMPAWNALYEMRDFGYHVLDLRATDSNLTPRRVTRIDQQTWRIEGQGDIRVEYATYWDEPGPFGTQINAEHAFLNLAMVLCYVPDRRREDAVVHFTDLTPGWRVGIELPKASAPDGAETAYSAPNYDALVDAPAEVAAFEELHFQAAGHPIRAILHGDVVDHAHLTEMLSQIVEYQSRLMGGAPFAEYLFLLHVGRSFGGGGMEHANSTAISVESAAALPNVAAHEFFHLWNVKRIRPQSLEPIDYAREMWTPSLWFAEGVTSTYASYTLVRTGLWSKAQFLNDLGEQITELASRPARRWQSVEESSIGTWLEKYPLFERPDFSISYYNKGQLLGVALDITMRDLTDNRASLDDVLRGLNQDYAQRGRFYPESAGIREVAEDVLRRANGGAGADLGSFFARYVAATDELPFGDLLSRAGLALEEHGQAHAAMGFTVTRNSAGAAVVSDLDIASSAAQAGIREGDTLVSLNGSDVARNVPRWLRDRQPGQTVRASIRRGDLAKELSFALAEEEAHTYSVAEVPHPSDRQSRILNGMLRGTTDAGAARPAIGQTNAR
jgi:predicted metalloprotease with PDZ domain